MRTHCGTVSYQAPELLGLLPRGVGASDKSYTKNVDIWAFGALLHEVLTSEIPFLEQADVANLSINSFAITSIASSVDMDLLFHYCRGQPFPTAALQHHNVSSDGITLVESLMAPNPIDRISAANALKAKWLAEIPKFHATVPKSQNQTPFVMEDVRPIIRPVEARQIMRPMHVTASSARPLPAPLLPRTQSGELTGRFNRVRAPLSQSQHRMGLQDQDQPSPLFQARRAILSLQPPPLPPALRLTSMDAFPRLVPPLRTQPIRIRLVFRYFV